MPAALAVPRNGRRTTPPCPRRPTSSSWWTKPTARSTGASPRTCAGRSPTPASSASPAPPSTSRTAARSGPSAPTSTPTPSNRRSGDGATVPIFYEGRLPELRIIGQTIDQVFDRVFADRSDEERAAIRQRYATEQAIAGAPRRIEAICLDLIDHLNQVHRPQPVQSPGGRREPPRRGHLQGDAGPAERPRVGGDHVGGPQRRGTAGAPASRQGATGPAHRTVQGPR